MTQSPVPEYVLGFLFLHNRQSVVLIRKTKPEFQAGKLNGVGGRIEPTDESPHSAMVREFLEETGKLVTDWRKFAALEFPGATVYCFSAEGNTMDLRLGERSLTEERVHVYFVDDYIMHSPTHAMANLRWLIPLALSGETAIPTIRFDALV